MSVLDEIKELREILKSAPPNMDYGYDGFQDEMRPTGECLNFYEIAHNAIPALCNELEKAIETLRQIEDTPEASWEAYGIRIKARALLKEWGLE